MPYRVELPDGSIAEFPDEVTPGMATVSIRELLGQGPSGKPLFPPSEAPPPPVQGPVMPTPAPPMGPVPSRGGISLGDARAFPSILEAVRSRIAQTGELLPEGISQGPLGMPVAAAGQAIESITPDQAVAIGARFGIAPEAVEAGARVIGGALRGAVSPTSTAIGASMGVPVVGPMVAAGIAGQGVYGLASEAIPKTIAGAIEGDPGMAAEGVASGLVNAPLAAVAYPLARATQGAVGAAGIPARTARLEAAAAQERIRQDLGIPPSATPEQVAAARGQALRAVHPDIAPDLPPDVAQAAIQRLQATKQVPPVPEHPLISEIADAVTRRLFGAEASTVPVREPVIPTIEGVRGVMRQAEGIPPRRRLPGVTVFSEAGASGKSVPDIELFVPEGFTPEAAIQATGRTARTAAPPEPATSQAPAPVVEISVPPPRRVQRDQAIAERLVAGEEVTVPQIRREYGVGRRVAEETLQRAQELANRTRGPAAPAAPPPAPIPPPLRPEPVEQTSAEPIRPPGPRWQGDRGAIPGEPFAYLDGFGDEAKVALIETQTPRGAIYSAVTNEGRSLGDFPTVQEAAAAAESHFPAEPLTGPQGGPTVESREEPLVAPPEVEGQPTPEVGPSERPQEVRGPVPSREPIAAPGEGPGLVPGQPGVRARVVRGSLPDVPLPVGQVYKGIAPEGAAGRPSHLAGQHWTGDKQYAEIHAGPGGTVKEAVLSLENPFSVVRDYPADYLRTIDAGSADRLAADAPDRPINGMAFLKAIRDDFVSNNVASGETPSLEVILAAKNYVGDKLRAAGHDAIHHEVYSPDRAGKSGAWAVLDDSRVQEIGGAVRAAREKPEAPAAEKPSAFRPNIERTPEYLAEFPDGADGIVRVYPLRKGGFGVSTFNAETGEGSGIVEKFEDQGQAIAFAKSLVGIEGEAPAEKTVQPSPEAQAPALPAGPDPHLRLARAVALAVSKVNGRLPLPLTQPELMRLAEQAFGKKSSEGGFLAKEAYDAMELGVNQALLADKSLTPDEVELLLPNQSRRSGDMDTLQQFSTPPRYAEVIADVANIGPNDVVLEPSAGTGNIVTAALRRNPLAVHANELAPSRRKLLENLDSMKRVTVYGEDAEQISNTFPKDVRPTVVVMNPPFSATGGRTSKMDLQTGAKHIAQAFALLQPGGRLVAIVGRGMSPEAPLYRAFFSKMEPYLRANVGVDGKVYRKFGTTFGTRILVFDKDQTALEVLPGESNEAWKARAKSLRPKVVTGDVQYLVEATKLLKGVKDARIPSTPPAATGKPEPALSGSAAKADRGETVPRRPEPVPAPTDAVGTRIGEGEAQGRPLARSEGDAGPTGLPQRAPVGAPVPPRAGKPARPVQPGGDEVAQPEVGGGRTVGPTPREDGRNEGGVPAEDRGLEVGDSGVTADSGELTEAIYETYKPKRLKVEGSVTHPTPLVESSAMATVIPPPVTYSPHIDPAVIRDGRLSDAQLEPIVYAAQAHNGPLLPNGSRRGYFIGDGTGVGKGREIAGIILDNWNQGRKKAVWISEKWKLFEDAKRDMADIGFDPRHLVSHKDAKADAEIKGKDGVLFTTYDTLKMEKGGEGGRIGQITRWLGSDFDGVLVYDEAHNMGNARDEKGGRGMKKASKKALSGLALQRALPKARVVYVSATGATEVSNLAYADRLGLWGPGTAFPDVATFIAQVGSGGLSSMELVARDMKALGKYLSRSLSFQGVGYDRMTHPLTENQRQIYDELASSWQIVLNNVHDALGLTASTNDKYGRTKVDGRAKAAALSAFYGAELRFFNQILTSMQMPTVIKGIEKALADGNAAVVQLVNTNEAVQERQLAKVREEEDLENLDMTPREQLAQYLENAFPVAQMVEVEDADGNITMAPAKDSAGNVIVNQQAVELRDALLEKIGSLRVPEGPLEMLINHFGPKRVAEVTGRSRRVVRTEEGKVEVQKRGAHENEAEIGSFQGGKKDILVFSQAGGTGASYHADKRAVNQKKRVHFLVQAGWRADQAIQGFGRTHRSNQVQPPEYLLVSTDLPGHKRFISTIARRLDQLGALTKGQRTTGGQGLFSELDNLESTHAKDALVGFFRDVATGRIDGVSVEDFQKQTGLRLVSDQGTLLEETPPMTQFLNRLLAMNIEMQNLVFDAYFDRLQKTIELAIQTGTLDVGVENYKAEKIVKNSEQVVYKDKDSGAETKYVALTATHKIRLNPFPKDSKYRFITNKKSGKVFAVDPNIVNFTTKGGDIEQRVRLIAPNENKLEDRWDVTIDSLGGGEGVGRRFQEVTREDAEKLWTEQAAKMPKTRETPVHLITGAVLPIWDRIAGKPRVYRLVAGEERMLGRVIDPADLEETMQRLGAKAGSANLTPEQAFSKVMDDGWRLKLANGWTIRRRTVSGEDRVEIEGKPRQGLEYAHVQELKHFGAISERISYETRVFVPNAEILTKILESKPIVEAYPSGAERVVGTTPFQGGGESVGAAAAGGQMDRPPLGARIRSAIRAFRGEDTRPARDLSKFKKLQDIFGGYGLNQLAEASPAAAQLARYTAGGWAKADRLIAMSIPRLAKILGGKMEVEKFFTALAESRLRGIKDKYDAMTASVEEMSDEDLVKAAKEGVFETPIDALDGQRGFGDADLAGDWARAVEGGDAEEIRSFLSETFDTAKFNVGTMDLGEDFNSYISRLEVQEALRVYKETLEPALRRSHELNEGIFARQLGPLDTYYPLIRGPGGERPGVSMKPPYARPKNPHNYFATGLGETYDPSIKAFKENLARSIRANGKAGLLGTLQAEGLLIPLRRGQLPPPTMFFEGKEYEAVQKEIGARMMLSKDGKVIHLPSPKAVIPKWLDDEIGSIIEPDRRHEENFWQELTGAITKIQMGGPTDAVYHTANLLGTLILKSPIVGTDLISKAASLTQITKAIAAIANVLATKPDSPENQKILREMLENGQIPNRIGSVTYSKKYAELTGAEKVSPVQVPWHRNREGKLRPRFPIDFGPLVFGPHGVDVRARVLMERMGREIARNVEHLITPEERFEWTRQMGNYNFETEGRIERKAKSSGLSPFYTAGRQMNWNGVAGMLGTGTLPVGEGWKAQTFNRYRVMNVMSGVIGLTALWAVVHKLVTDKWPWEMGGSRLFQVPLPKEARESELGKRVWGPDTSKTAWVNVAGLNPLVARGLRVTGLKALTEGALNKQDVPKAVDQAEVDILNGWLHPFLGPPSRTLFTAVFGQDPYITKLRDERGRPSIEMKSALGREKVKPGLAGIGQKLAIAVEHANPIVQRLQEGAEQGLPVERRLLDTFLPNFIKGPTTSKGTALEKALAERPMPSFGPMTEDQEKKYELKRDLTVELRNAKTPEERTAVRAKIAEARKSEVLTRRESKNLTKKGEMSDLEWKFSQVPIREALDLWELATPEQQELLRPILKKKAYGTFDRTPAWRTTLPRAQREEVQAKIKEVFGR